jgi:3,4-dihydroxy 2-butanone 4-phosphate synthase/GTP cyclohydrolase II
MFPLRYQPGGVLVRAGQTEASVDLAVLAGMYPAAVICEIMAEDGTMMRLPQLEVFAARHDLRIISVAQLIRHRAATERLVARTVEARLPTAYGDFTVHAYKAVTEHEPHLALVLGDVARGGPVLTRVHSECLTGDIFGSLRCDCGEQLDLALRRVAAEGRGVVLYMRQEGRGIGLHNKLRAYQLQDEGLDTVEANERLGFAADLRHYGVGAQILVDLGVREMRLLTNNPKKVVGLEAGYGLRVVEQIPLLVPENPENARYLETKRIKLGHRLIAKTPCPDQEKIAAATRVIRPKAAASRLQAGAKPKRATAARAAPSEAAPSPSPSGSARRARRDPRGRRSS